MAPVDLVPVFLDAVECARPATPAVVVENPDSLYVAADPALLSRLLGELVSVAVHHAMHRAEIRLELGARPGCSFFLRDNGDGATDAEALAPAARIAGESVAHLRVTGEYGWGSTVLVALTPRPEDDGTHRPPYTGPVSLG